MKLLPLLVLCLAMLPSALRAGLVSHWKFDNAALPGDDTGPLNLDATAEIGSPQISPDAKIGTGALLLDGTGALVLGTAAPAYASAAFSDGFSVAAWVKIDEFSPSGPGAGNAAYQRILSRDMQGAATFTGRGWGVGFDRALAGTDRMLGTTYGVVDRRSTAVTAVGAWHHFAYIYRGTAGVIRGVDFYVDGQLVTSSTATPAGLNATLPTDTYTIGALNYLTGSNFQGFRGFMDDLRVYDTELTPDELTNLAAGNDPGPGDPSITAAATVSFQSNGAPEVFSIPFSNAGAANVLTVSGVTVGGTNAPLFTVESFTPSLLPGTEGSVKVKFAGAPGGDYSATLTLASNDPFRPTRPVALTVTTRNPLIQPGSAQITWPVLAPGQVPEHLTFPVTNAGGSQSLHISLAAFSGVSSGNFGIVGYTPVIAPGATGQIVISFNPGAEDGNFSALLEITSDSTVNPLLEIPITASVPISNPDNYLVSHFTFDNEGDPFADTGTFQHHGTAFGDAARTTEARKGAGALMLDGDGDLVDVGGTDDYSSLGDALDGDGFTVAAWVNRNPLSDGATWRVFSTYMPGGFNAAGWGVGGLNTGALLGTTYGVIDYQAAGSIPASGEWHHLAWVYRGSPISACDIYVDGVLAGTDSRASGYRPTANSFVIGALGPVTALQFFHGLIDDLRIYSRQLAAGNIEALISAGPVVIPVTAVSYNGGKPQFTWQSSPGAVYSVYRSTDLSGWTLLSGTVASGGITTSYTDAALPGGMVKVFYKAALNP